MLYKIVLTFDSACYIKMKAFELCVPLVLFIMLYKVVLTFECVDESFQCDHSNEYY